MRRLEILVHQKYLFYFICFYFFHNVGVCIIAKSTVFTISTICVQSDPTILDQVIHHISFLPPNSRDVKGTHTRYSNKIIFFIFLQHHRSFQLHFTDFWTSYLSITLLYQYSKSLQMYTTACLWLKIHNLVHRNMNRNLQISSSSLVTKQRFPMKKDKILLKQMVYKIF